MKKQLFIFSLFFMIIFQFGCNQNPTENEIHNYQKLKRIYIGEYKYSEYYYQNGLLTKTHTLLDTNFVREIEFIYDENNRLVRSDKVDFIFGSIESYYKIFYYDENNNIIKTQTFLSEDNQPTKYYRKYEYNDKDQLIRSIGLDSNNNVGLIYEFEYNEDNISKQNVFSKSYNDKLFSIIYEYDENPNPSPYPNNFQYVSPSTMSRNNIILSEQTFSTSTIKQFKSYKYDNNGYPLECESIYQLIKDNEITSQDTTVYIYEYY